MDYEPQTSEEAKRAAAQLEKRTKSGLAAPACSAGSDTPETDGAVLQVNLCDADGADATFGEIVHPEFARKLERERDEARAQARHAVEAGEALLRQRDEARKEAELCRGRWTDERIRFPWESKPNSKDDPPA